MHQFAIAEELWTSFSALAQRKRRRPESLAAHALREYLQKQDDEDLLKESERAAQAVDFRIEEAEELIRQRRERRQEMFARDQPPTSVILNGALRSEARP